MKAQPIYKPPYLYMDSASTTPVCTAAAESVMQYLGTGYGNPNSIHTFGREAKNAIEIARHEVAHLIGAKPDQILFAPSATIINRFLINRFAPRVLVSGMEHVSILNEAERMVPYGAEIIGPKPNANPENSPVTHFDVERYLTSAEEDKTGKGPDLVSVMTVNNETGVINDVGAIASLCRDRGILFHTDATAAAGAAPISVEEVGCDFMTFASHKMYGPKGAAALYVRNTEMAKDFRDEMYTGTENVAAIVGFGTACEQASARLDASVRFFGIETDNDYDRIASAFDDSILSNLKSKTYAYNAPSEFHFQKIVNVRFDGVDAESLVLLCSENGLMISAGAACESREKKPSHVLLAMGLTPDEARSSVRISFSRTTTDTDAWEAGRILSECVDILREQNNA